MSNFPDGMSLADIRRMEGDEPDDELMYDDDPNDYDDSWADD